MGDRLYKRLQHCPVAPFAFKRRPRGQGAGGVRPNEGAISLGGKGGGGHRSTPCPTTQPLCTAEAQAVTRDIGGVSCFVPGEEEEEVEEPWAQLFFGGGSTPPPLR